MKNISSYKAFYLEIPEIFSQTIYPALSLLFEIYLLISAAAASKQALTKQGAWAFYRKLAISSL